MYSERHNGGIRVSSASALSVFLYFLLADGSVCHSLRRYSALQSALEHGVTRAVLSPLVV